MLAVPIELLSRNPIALEMWYDATMSIIGDEIDVGLSSSVFVRFGLENGLPSYWTFALFHTTPTREINNSVIFLRQTFWTPTHFNIFLGRGLTHLAQIMDPVPGLFEGQKFGGGRNC